MNETPPCRPLKRVRYFAGQVISPTDLAEEQRYFREKLRRHNRFLHGAGVVNGLEVTSKRHVVRVSPGLALDCAGNEILVCEEVELAAPSDDGSLYITLNYHDVETDPVPVGEGNEPQASRFEEGYELRFEEDDPCADHRDGKYCDACGKAHGVTLARLDHGHGKWKVDKDFRRPRARS